MKHNNIYNKVKTLAVGTALVSLSAGMFSSCSDFLEVEPQNLITLDKFWNEKADVESVVSSCYSQMAAYNTVARILMWGEFRSENFINKTQELTDANLQRALREDITASNPYTTWNDFYTVINRCNTVLKYAPQVAANDPSYTQGQLNANLAEVTALRSLCYFYLIRTFAPPRALKNGWVNSDYQGAGIPYTTEAYIDDSQELVLPQTDFYAVLDSCIASLEAVQGNAMTKYGASDAVAEKYYNTGRITQSAIWAMLADMYLWKEDYDNCIKYADKVIKYKENEIEQKINQTSDNKTYGKFGNYYLLANGYSDGGKWKTGMDFAKIFSDGNSIESIFELSYIKGDKNKQSNDLAAAWFGNATNAGSVTYTTYLSKDESDLDDPKVFSKANGGLDVRGYENFDKSSNNGGVTKLSTSSISINVDTKKTAATGTLYDKAGSSNPNKCNVIIYRLTDVMLLKAEAYAQKMSGAEGKLSDADKAYRDSAFALVDAVNRRSLMADASTSTSVLPSEGQALSGNAINTKLGITDLVYEERERELMYEGKRFYDLVRRSLRDGNTTYLTDHVMNKDSNLEGIINSKFKDNINAIFWPINLDEIKASNYSYNQNPAYNSGESSSMQKNY